MRIGRTNTVARGATRRVAGFTLLELTSVVAIVLVLVSLLCAALNHTKAKALRISCIDNLRQLQLAWTFYVDDNDDWLPLNRTAPAPPSNHHRIMPLASSTNSWVTGSPLIDGEGLGIRRGTLYPYVRSMQPYRCPMDSSTLSGRPDLPRLRSYSMNTFLAGDDAGKDRRVKSKAEEIQTPGKENVFVFIEEHEDSVWASSFLLAPKERLTAVNNNWISTPSDRHYQGCNISFADGHVEYWKWYSPKAPKDATRLASSGRDFTDIRRLQETLPQ